MKPVPRNDSLSLINGVIYPMAPPGRAQAIFTRAGKIELIGSDREVLSKCDTKTVVLDMKGKFIMPGLTDANCSLIETGRLLELSDNGSGDKADALSPRGAALKNSAKDIARWYRRAADEMLRFGITSVMTDDAKNISGAREIFDFYAKAEADGEMPLRVTHQWSVSNEKELAQFLKNETCLRESGVYFKSGPIKIRVDGTLGERTAALREEYSDDPGNVGICIHSQDELDKLVGMAARKHLRVTFAATGDGAADRALNSAAAHRHGAKCMITDCRVGSEEIYKKMAALGVSAVIQPTSVFSDCMTVLSRLGPERARWSCAWKSLNSFGVKTGVGSNAPFSPLNPFLGIRAAFTRQNEEGKPEHGWMPAERIDRVEAFSIYSAGGAAACGDDYRGTLEVGKAADIIALMDNPFQITDEELPGLKVGLTVVDGRIRHIC